jgi:hypothetical protein
VILERGPALLRRDARCVQPVRVTRQRRRVPDCALVVARRDADLSPKQKQGAYLTIMNVPTLAMHGDGDQVGADRGFGAALSKAPQEGETQGLREISAWHVHHTRRCGEPRTARLHSGIADAPDKGDHRSSTARRRRSKSARRFRPIAIGAAREIRRTIAGRSSSGEARNAD